MNYYIIDNKIIGYNEPLDSELYNYQQLTQEQSDFYELHRCSIREVLALKLDEPTVIPENEIIESLKRNKNYELNENLDTKLKQGFTTTINEIKADCLFESVTKQGLGLQMYQLENKQESDLVIFCDYDNNINQITFADYKELIRQTGAYYSNCLGAKWQKRMLLESLTTKEEIEAFDTEI